MKIGLLIRATVLTLVAMLIGAVLHSIIYAADVSNQSLYGDKFVEFVRANAILAIIASALVGYLLMKPKQGDTENNTFLFSAIAGAALAVVIVYVLEALLLPAGASRCGLVMFSFVGLIYRDDLQTWNLVASVGSGVAFSLGVWFSTRTS